MDDVKSKNSLPSPISWRYVWPLCFSFLKFHSFTSYIQVHNAFEFLFPWTVRSVLLPPRPVAPAPFAKWPSIPLWSHHDWLSPCTIDHGSWKAALHTACSPSVTGLLSLFTPRTASYPAVCHTPPTPLWNRVPLLKYQVTKFKGAICFLSGPWHIP